MSFIIMATDECGDEFRPYGNEYATMAEAQAKIPEAREDYPECRRIWAEELHDKAYWMELRNQFHDDYEYDAYCEAMDRAEGGY